MNEEDAKHWICCNERAQAIGLESPFDYDCTAVSSSSCCLTISASGKFRDEIDDDEEWQDGVYAGKGME